MVSTKWNMLSFEDAIEPALPPTILRVVLFLLTERPHINKQIFSFPTFTISFFLESLTRRIDSASEQNKRLIMVVADWLL